MFFKIDGEQIISGYAIAAPGFTLTEENHTEHTYPMDGWYWFATAQEALAGLQINDGSITALQGMLAINQLGMTGAFLSWKAGLDPMADFETLAFIEKALHWTPEHPAILAAAVAFGMTLEQKAGFFALAKTL